MKKVLIFTKHSAYNYGAMLQAYALQKTVQDLDADCRIIDLRQPKPSVLYSWRSPYGILKNIAYRLYKKDFIKTFSLFEKFIDLYEKTERYDSEWDLYNNPPQADIYISGSDQVWNPLKITEAAFLRFAPKDKIRASYAASLGISYLPQGDRNLVSEYIKDFDYISVREDTGKQILETLTDKNIETHIDPTLLRSKDDWAQLASDISIDGPYILCYILYRPKWLNKYLKKLHRKTKKKIVVISSDPCRNIYHNKIIRHAGPKEFLGLLRGADFVVSSSFHGVALSIANEKPFYAIVNPDAPSRISNLLEKLSLQSRVVNENYSLHFSEIDYTGIREIVALEKQKAISYLSMLLNAKKSTPIAQASTIRDKEATVSTVKDKCTACTVCVNVCPKKAITMRENEKGFLYPIIDESKCVHCGLCFAKCHALTRSANTKESCDAMYGWIKNEEIRHSSTSGGIFSALSDVVLKDGGLVVAAYFDEKTKSIRHTSSDDVNFEKFRRSKYAESHMDDALEKIENALSRNRSVLFCGTPCQCAGVRRRFGEDERLLICDFLCHGVPSGKVFKDTLEMLEARKKKQIVDYRFRTKSFGWSNYGVKICYSNGKEKNTVGRCDWFFRATMLDNLFLRDACYTCDRGVYHEADITLGDFWGIANYNPKLNDQKGISVLLINTERGRLALQQIQEECCLYPLDKKYINYALQVKLGDKKQKQSEKEFIEYNKSGVKKYAKKHYSKKLLLSKFIFSLKKRKLSRGQK